MPLKTITDESLYLSKNDQCPGGLRGRDSALARRRAEVAALPVEGPRAGPGDVPGRAALAVEDRHRRPRCVSCRKRKYD